MAIPQERDQPHAQTNQSSRLPTVEVASCSVPNPCVAIYGWQFSHDTGPHNTRSALESPSMVRQAGSLMRGG